MTIMYDEDGVRLIQGEAVEQMLQLRGERFAAVITDPPYSSGGATRSDRRAPTSQKYLSEDNPWYRAVDFEGDSRDGLSWERWCAWWLSVSFSLVDPGGVALMFCDWRRLPNATTALQMAGFVWRGIVVWDKGPIARPQLGRFRNQSEFIVWGSRGPHQMKGPALLGVVRDVPTTQKKFHQTGKPVGLMMELLKIVPGGGAVLDPFAGSASTLVAARIMGLPCTGIEWSPEICEIALQRLRSPRAAHSTGPLFGEE